jgi:hypothetical protein
MTDKPDIPGTYGAGIAPAGVSVTVRTYAVQDGLTALAALRGRACFAHVRPMITG